MLVVGITGSMGTGKTTVADIFARLGAVVIDADEISHRLIRKGSSAWRRIKSYFGEEILERDNSINRKALAKIVFTNKNALSALCGIIHPLVYKEIEDRIKKIRERKPRSVIIIDAPVLIESGGRGRVDRVIVVKAAKRIQVERARRETGLTCAEISRRIKAQMPLSQKVGFADFVIDNSGSLASTERQAKQIWKNLVRE